MSSLFIKTQRSNINRITKLLNGASPYFKDVVPLPHAKDEFEVVFRSYSVPQHIQLDSSFALLKGVGDVQVKTSKDAKFRPASIIATKPQKELLHSPSVLFSRYGTEQLAKHENDEFYCYHKPELETAFFASLKSFSSKIRKTNKAKETFFSINPSQKEIIQEQINALQNKTEIEDVEEAANLLGDMYKQAAFQTLNWYGNANGLQCNTLTREELFFLEESVNRMGNNLLLNKYQKLAMPQNEIEDFPVSLGFSVKIHEANVNPMLMHCGADASDIESESLKQVFTSRKIPYLNSNNKRIAHIQWDFKNKLFRVLCVTNTTAIPMKIIWSSINSPVFNAFDRMTLINDPYSVLKQKGIISTSYSMETGEEVPFKTTYHLYPRVDHYPGAIVINEKRDHEKLYYHHEFGVEDNSQQRSEWVEKVNQQGKEIVSKYESEAGLNLKSLYFRNDTHYMLSFDV